MKIWELAIVAIARLEERQKRAVTEGESFLGKHKGSLLLAGWQLDLSTLLEKGRKGGLNMAIKL